MVATRNHPSDFQEPELPPSRQESPRKRNARPSAADNEASPITSTARSITNALSTALPSPTQALQRGSAALSSLSPPSGPAANTRSRHNKHGWSHTPSNLTLLWLTASLPLVVWDTGYVLLRPLSMPGGSLHKPLWTPYELYGTVDYVYGTKALEANNGWTAAQGSVNALETLLYIVYLYLVYAYGEPETKSGRGAPEPSTLGRLRALGESRTVYGKTATWLVLLGYSVATVTFWKTVLYWLIEAFSGFENIGHNNFTRLLFLWLIPNGAWLVFPAYMIYVFGREILQGLEVATESRRYR